MSDTPTTFARRTMEHALDEMRTRLRALEPLLAEYEGLKGAIKAQEKALRALPEVRRALPAPAPAPTPALDPAPAPHRAAPAMGRRPAADSELGTVKQQIYRLLSREDARRGVAGAVVARAVRGAQANSVLAQLSSLANDDDEAVERIGKGFYRLSVAEWEHVHEQYHGSVAA